MTHTIFLPLLNSDRHLEINGKNNLREDSLFKLVVLIATTASFDSAKFNYKLFDMFTGSRGVNA